MSIQKGVALVGKIKVTLTREELPFNLHYMTAEKPVDDTASLDKKLGSVINKQTNKQIMPFKSFDFTMHFKESIQI